MKYSRNIRPLQISTAFQPRRPVESNIYTKISYVLQLHLFDEYITVVPEKLSKISRLSPKCSLFLFWCPYMVIKCECTAVRRWVSPWYYTVDPVRLTLGNPFNTIKSSCSYSQYSHLNVLRIFPPRVDDAQRVYLNKNMNAFKPSEHPPDQGENCQNVYWWEQRL